MLKARLDNMGDINEYVRQKRDARMEQLLSSSDRDLYNQQCKIEKDMKGDYAGREILELLQNAEDASSKNGVVEIIFENNLLVVKNTGLPFSEEGVNSLLTAYNSSKNKNESIGNKGLGFRALLNNSEYIQIFSEHLSIEFSEQHAREYQKICEEKYNTKLEQRPPILLSPRIISEENRDSWATIVKVKIKNETSNRIEEMLDEIDEKTLIFLRKISEIRVVNGDKSRTYKKIQTSDGIKIVKTDIFGESETNYLVVRRDLVYKKQPDEMEDGDNPEEKVEIVLARKMNAVNSYYGTLYSYFRTEIQFPTDWIIHANFDLNTSRNETIKNRYNWFIYTNIIDMMIGYSEKVARNTFGYEGLSYLVGNYEKFDDDIKWAGQTIRELFLEKINSAKLLPTVNNEYVSFDEGPYFYKSKLATILKGNDFAQLLQYTDDDSIIELINHFFVRRYDDLVYRINRLLPRLNDYQRVQLSKYYYDEFLYDNDNETERPNFFLTNLNQLIEWNDSIFTEGAENEGDLPSYLKIKFVKREMITHARNILGVDSQAFETSEYAKFYNIRQYRLENIARAFYQKSEKYSHAVDFIKWLYQKREKINLERLRLNGLNLNVPIKQGRRVTHAKNVYLTAEYGYPLNEKLYPTGVSFITNPAEFGISKNEIESFVNFLVGFGVNKLPQLNIDGSLPNFDSILSSCDFGVILELLGNRDLDILNSDNTIESLRRYDWLEIDGSKYSLSDLILDKRYAKKIPGIIGLSPEKLSKIIGNDILSRIYEKSGSIAKKIVDLDNSQIYEVLLNLEKLSKDLIVSIQHDLSDQPSEWNENLDCEEYERYLAEGKVLCVDGNIYPISEVKYLANNILPSAVTEGQKLIDVYRKKGAEKIKKIFGVEKLEVEYEIKSFSLSEHSDRIIDKTKNVKIGLIASPKIETAENVVQRIRAAKIYACDNVTVSIESNEKNLNEYDFAISGNEYYLVLPKELSLNQVLSDPKTINVIAEIFVAIIGNEQANEVIDTIRFFITVSDLKATIELEDDGLDNWTKAKMALSGKNIEQSLFELRQKNYKAARELLKSSVLCKKYDMAQYEKLEKADRNEQKYYEKLTEEFRRYELDVDDDIFEDESFDAESYILGEYFRDLNSTAENNCGLEQRDAFFASLSDDERDVFKKDPGLRSLARFSGNEDYIKAEISNAIEESYENVSENSSSKKPRATKQANEYVVEGTFTPIDDDPKKKRNGHFGGHGGGGNYHGMSDDEKSEIGREGQKKAREWLEERLGVKVRDVSGYAYESGENIDGNDEKGYDLEYDKDGKTHYVEVKSSKNNGNRFTFELSENEYKTAKEKTNKPDSVYEVCCVAGVKTEKIGYCLMTFDEIKDDLYASKYKYSKKIVWN